MNFVYCPAQIRAALVAARVDLRYLLDVSKLANILSPEDVAFYLHCNCNTDKLMPLEIVQSLDNPILFSKVGEKAGTPYDDLHAALESLTVSNEGVAGAFVGFLLGSSGRVAGGAVGSVAGPLGALVGNYAGKAAVDGELRRRREKLKQQIEVISGRLATLRNGDIAEAKRRGIKIRDKDLEPVKKTDVMESAALGLVIPFYTAYQGSEVENLKDELDEKIKELKTTFRAHNLSTEALSAQVVEDIKRAHNEYSVNGNAPVVLTEGQKLTCDLMDENTIIFSHAPLAAGEAADNTPEGLRTLLDRLIQQLVVFHPFEVVAEMPLFGRYLRASQAIMA